MDLKNLKPILGRWLTIEELRGFLTETPEEVVQQVPINRKLLETASEFVEARQGRWEHPDWEGFLARLSNDGFRLSKELEPPIGNILEIFKAYYHRDGFEAIAEKRRKPAAQKHTRANKATTAPGRKQTIKQA
jgi:hypothetical protein